MQMSFFDFEEFNELKAEAKKKEAPRKKKEEKQKKKSAPKTVYKLPLTLKSIAGDLVMTEGTGTEEEVKQFLAEQGPFFAICDVSKKEDASDATPAYISSAYADKYLLDIGDEITLKEAYEDDTYTFSIEGIYDYEGGLTVFLPQDTLNELFDLGSDYFSGYLSDSEITDINQKYIGSMIDLDSLSKISRQLNVSMGSMMYLLDGFSIVLFMILIYLLSKIIIEKNAQSISMTKILGYSDREISSLYLLSTTIMVVIFLLLSFPIETVLMKALFRGIMISSISGWIPLYIDPVLYVKMFLLGFGTYLLVALIEYRRIKKVPMDQALKNIE